MDFSSLNPANAASKKRPHMTQELAGKFSAKSDFIKFFKEQRKYRALTLTFLSIV
jgi:hypothetical protein